MFILSPSSSYICILCFKSDKFINQSITCMYLCFSDVFFGGEALTAEQPQSFTCPYCSKMGYTEALLQEHVTGEHADTSNEVVNKCAASLETCFLARLHEVQKSYCSHHGRTRSRHTLLKYSRSHFDNQLSESIHSWTIGTL